MKMVYEEIGILLTTILSAEVLCLYYDTVKTVLTMNYTALSSRGKTTIILFKNLIVQGPGYYKELKLAVLLRI